MVLHVSQSLNLLLPLYSYVNRYLGRCGFPVSCPWHQARDLIIEHFNRSNMAGRSPFCSIDSVFADIIKGRRLQASLARIWRTITIHLPPPNFIILHYAYFIGVCLVSSIIFWGASTPARSISYTDSLFLVVSAMTLAGLNTINLSAINTFQQFMLFLLIIFGSAILVSIVTVHIRRKAFERKFKSVLDRTRRRGSFMSRMSFNRSRTRVDESGPAGPGAATHPGGGTSQEKPSSDNGPIDLHTFVAQENAATGLRKENGSPESNVSLHTSGMRDMASKDSLSMGPGVSRRLTFASTTSPTRNRRHSPMFSMQGVGARGDISNHPRKIRSSSNELSRISEHDQPEAEDGSRSGFDLLSSILVGRNSQFSNLTLAEREKLGGVEYRAVSILAVIVPVYFVLWQLLGCIGLGAYVAMNSAEATEVNSENPWYFTSGHINIP